MEGDRAAVLTLRSAARGVVDYSKADIHDGSWWQRWRYLLRAMESEDYSKSLDYAFQFQLALVSHGRLGSDNFTKVQKEAKAVFQDLEDEMRPWTGRRSKEDRQTAETDAYDEIWKKAAGFSLRDSEAVQAWNEELTDYLTNQTEKEEAERKKTELPEQAFEERVKDIRDKRKKQQGR